MLRSFLTLLFVLRAIGLEQLEHPCPADSDAGNRCSGSITHNYSFETDCATSVSLAMPSLELLTLTYTCYNISTQEAIDCVEVFYYRHSDDIVNENISLPASEGVYCTFTACGYDPEADYCSYVLDDFETCSWPTATITGLDSMSATLVSSSTYLVSTTLSKTNPTSSSTSDMTSGLTNSVTMTVVVVLVIVFVVVTMAMVMFVWRRLVFGHHSWNKGQAVFINIPYSVEGSGLDSSRMILEDDISLAPSVTTIYATGYFHLYANTADVVEDEKDLLSHGGDSASLDTVKAENLPCYNTDDDHDFKRKKDSLITMDNRFSSQTTLQGQADTGAETTLTPSHQEHAILATNVPIPICPSNSGFTFSDYGYTSSTNLSSSNDGYIRSDMSGYRQCRASLSSSASEYQPTLRTTTPCMSPSLSEMSLDIELQEEQKTIGEDKTALNPPHEDGYIHADLPTTMPDNNVDSGCKQADLFLSPEVFMCQPSLTENTVSKKVSLNEVEAEWVENTGEGIPNPSITCAKDNCISLLSREQLKDGCVSIDSSGYLKDNLTSLTSFEPHGFGEDQKYTVHLPLGEHSLGRRLLLDSSGYLKGNLTSLPSRAPHSSEEGLETVCLPLGAQSRDSQLSPHVDSSGYLKDNLTSPPSRAPHSSEEGLETVCLPLGVQSRDSQLSPHVDSSGYLKDNLTSLPSRALHGSDDGLHTVHLPMGTLAGTGDANLQTSAGLATDCEFDDACYLDLAQSRQDNNGCDHAIRHSREGGNGYIHAAVQSKQDSDGYIHSGLEPFPSMARSTVDPNPCYDSDLDDKELFLKVEGNNGSATKCITMSGSVSDAESNLVFSDSDDYIMCDVPVPIAQPVQSSALQPMCCSIASEVSDSSGYIQSMGFFSNSTPNRMPRPLCPATDNYIYT